ACENCETSERVSGLMQGRLSRFYVVQVAILKHDARTRGISKPRCSRKAKTAFTSAFTATDRDRLFPGFRHRDINLSDSDVLPFPRRSPNFQECALTRRA